MSRVETIEEALTKLSLKEFEEVERWMSVYKEKGGPGRPDVHALHEYGVSENDLEKLDKRMEERLQKARKEGSLKPYSGDIEKDLAD